MDLFVLPHRAVNGDFEGFGMVLSAPLLSPLFVLIGLTFALRRAAMVTAAQAGSAASE